MKKYITIYYIFKVLLFLFGLYFIYHYVGGNYDCVKKCSLADAGFFLGLFLLLSFCLFFIENMRQHTFKMLQIYIPAMFILFSAVNYLDITQHEQQLKIEKEYIDFKIMYASAEFKNASKIDIENQIMKNLDEHKKTAEEYGNTVLNGYKDMVGRAMMGLTLGCTLILLLEWINICSRNKQLVFINESKNS